jgi:hypothetical protein
MEYIINNLKYIKYLIYFKLQDFIYYYFYEQNIDNIINNHYSVIEQKILNS